MKLHDRNLLMTQSNIQCITKKHHRIEKEVMKKGGGKYRESKMIMAESLNSTTVYD